MATEMTKVPGRRGRRPLAYEHEQVGYRLPPGTILAVKAMMIPSMRWNGLGVTEGLVLSEAALALAWAAQHHPGLSRGQRLLVREYAERLYTMTTDAYVSVVGGPVTRFVPKPDQWDEPGIWELDPQPDGPAVRTLAAGGRRMRRHGDSRNLQDVEIDKVATTVPVGMRPLIRVLAGIYWDRNAAPVPEGVVLAEGVVALGTAIRNHPGVTDGERAVVSQLVADVSGQIGRFYKENGIRGIVL